MKVKQSVIQYEFVSEIIRNEMKYLSHKMNQLMKNMDLKEVEMIHQEEYARISVHQK